MHSKIIRKRIMKLYPALLCIYFTISSCSMLVNSNFVDGNEQYPVIHKPSNTASLPIGMNLSGVNYYTTNLMFTDVFKNTTKFFTTYEGGSFNSGNMDEIEVDENGYPSYLPQSTTGSEETFVRFMVNDHYSGRYRIYFDGTGSFDEWVKSDERGYYIDLDGKGTNTWLTMNYSDINDPMVNIRILPELYGPEDEYPTFLPEFTEGLEQFHCLRFMDWAAINESQQVEWSDRVTKNDACQGGPNGVSFDYAIELCNLLQTDAWVCVPHRASDDYIRKLAILWRDNLDSNLQIYIEYSNELWNWAFSQAHWIQQNATDCVESYVVNDLPNLAGYPEKDAYMMARMFNIWSDVFSGEENRITRVATGQATWYGNTGRILTHLFDVDGTGCDAFGVTGYFWYTDENHEAWLKEGASLTDEKIYRDVYNTFLDMSCSATRGTAEYCRKYGIDYLVYEGGQHLDPKKDRDDWNYIQPFWDFQISDRMYDMYMHNFDLHVEDDVDCKLFVAYSYISARESKYGSWGHLESLDQVGTNYSDAPKFRALLDANN